jgi:hypothetical protein
MVPFISGWLGWTAAILTVSLFVFAGAILLVFVRGDEPMVEAAD